MRSRKLSIECAVILATCGIALITNATSATAQTETILHDFTNTTTDGGVPYAGVIADKVGNLYGATEFGGTYRQGTIFELSPPSVAGGAWTETILYNFSGLADGGWPLGGLAFDSAGNLYGTTYNFGDPTFLGGVVFELSPPAVAGAPWTETVLYTFGSAGSSDGTRAWGTLVFDSSGNLYGVTVGGGTGNKSYCGPVGCGIVFQLKPPSVPGGAWMETAIYNFAASGGPDGYDPNSVLVGAGGILYGTTGFGGRGNGGTFFRLTPPAISGGAWTEKVLYTFGRVSGDGHYPNVLTPGPGGTFFGTTQQGGDAQSSGTVFELKPPSGGTGWTESVIYTLASAESGTTPVAGLALSGSGVLYGAALFGGSAQSGTLFKLTPPTAVGGTWTETTLHNFTNTPDGFGPFGNLLLRGGELFGTTDYGGTSSGGTVFRLVP